jgi:hypothetical protein
VDTYRFRLISFVLQGFLGGRAECLLVGIFGNLAMAPDNLSTACDANQPTGLTLGDPATERFGDRDSATGYILPMTSLVLLCSDLQDSNSRFGDSSSLS